MKAGMCGERVADSSYICNEDGLMCVLFVVAGETTDFFRDIIVLNRVLLSLIFSSFKTAFLTVDFLNFFDHLISLSHVSI